MTAAPVRAAQRRIVRDHCLAPSRTVDAPSLGARYDRMFTALPPLVTEPDALYAAGTPGGLCDASRFPSRPGHAPDDGQEAAGWPFFGQLVAHDITADRSPVGVRADVAALRNARSPRLNLEMVHAEGPVGSPYLYDAQDPALLLTAPDGLDLPRNWQGTALIGDPRNDVHCFVAHLHLAFLHAHNRLVDRLREDGVAEEDLFEEARRALVWHYQWIVVEDFLPRLVGRELVDEIRTAGPRFFSPPPGEAYIPLEFADAAYRYGHGQIRHRYRLQPGGPEYPLFPDLFGHGPIPPEHRLDWAEVFDLPGRAPAQRAKRLDGGLPASLIVLPREITGDVAVAEHRSLAVRDLLRGRATALPSGEAVADLFGEPALSRDEVGEEWRGGTPLWLYVLKEAQHRGGGNRLGPVGGRIVAEVLIGLLRADADAYLTVDPAWRPTLPAAGVRFGLADLLVFAQPPRAVP
ncbi:peroxidase family protein [Planosporangium sp. 12N6]|uniref:peroxidase family protein n=1 Tax=Planosporangium spinosum TaxID=3402278 RepID=UPI003CE88F60